MISEWLRVMLEEIERKRIERDEALAEARRRQLESVEPDTRRNRMW